MSSEEDDGIPPYFGVQSTGQANGAGEFSLLCRRKKNKDLPPAHTTPRSAMTGLQNSTAATAALRPLGPLGPEAQQPSSPPAWPITKESGSVWSITQHLIPPNWGTGGGGGGKRGGLVLKKQSKSLSSGKDCRGSTEERRVSEKPT